MLLVQGEDPHKVPGRTAQRLINLEVDGEDEDEDEEGEEVVSPQSRKKRGRTYDGQRYEICEHCKEDFDVLQEDFCTRHDGTSSEWLECTLQDD
jgi:hypothetical protein